MSHKALTHIVELEPLQEGQTIDVKEYIEKLRFFAKYSHFGIDNRFHAQGTYIAEKCYIEHTEIGLHYYKFETLINYFSKFACKKVVIAFSKNHLLSCEEAKN